MKFSSKSILWYKTLSIMLVTMIVTMPFWGCGGDDEEEIMPFNGIAVAETGDPDIPIIAVHENGSQVAVLAGDTPDSIGGAVYISEDDKSLTVWVGNDGLPSRAYSEGYTLVFGNYRDDKVDFAVITPDGETEIHRDVFLDMQELNSLAPSSIHAGSDLHQFLKYAGIILSIVGCLAATGATAGVFAVVCGAMLVKILLEVTASDNDALQLSSTALGAFAGGLGCVTGDVSGCYHILVEAATAFISFAESGMEKAAVKNSIEEVEKGFGIESAPITLYDLQGTYNLIGFTVIYSNGATITQDDIASYSGNLAITSNGGWSQEMVLEGQIITASAICKITANDTLYVESTSPACNYNLKFEMSGKKLTTFFSMGTCGSNYSETNVWQKISSSAPSALRYSVPNSSGGDQVGKPGQVVGGML